MSNQTCTHCEITFKRPDDAPIPADSCGRCSEELAALWPAVRAAGLKFDTEKPRFDLLLVDMPHALEAIARVLTVGAQKYAAGNWQHVENADRRYLAAGTRHELALAKGEKRDPETGEHHLAHKLCCDLFRLEMALRESE